MPNETVPFDITDPASRAFCILNYLPAPAECTDAQKACATNWYAQQNYQKLGEFMRNTQVRIYREFYGSPNKDLIGTKLYNLYAMREMISEAMRRKNHEIRADWPKQ